MSRKSGRKSGRRRPGTFTGKDDPRNGHGPAKGAANAGRPRSQFLAAMRGVVDRQETIARLKRLAGAGKTVSDETFLRAFKEAADRGYGKAVQPLEHTGPEGGPIPLDTPAATRERILRELAGIAARRRQGKGA